MQHPSIQDSGINDQGLQAIVEATPECIKIVAPDGSLTYMNHAGLCMVEAQSMYQVQGACIFDVIAPEHRAKWIEHHKRVCSGESLSWQFEIIGLGGSRRFMETHAVPLPNGNGSFSQLAVTRDISARKRAEDELRRNQIILQGQNRALELAVNGGELSDVLDILTKTIERHSDQKAFATILLTDKEGKHLLLGSAPSLPKQYLKTINGISVGPAVGSCGTAAHFKSEVNVIDIATDPRWSGLKNAALENNLRACWSNPIMSSDKVLGTFALYYALPQEPAPEDITAVRLLSRTAGIVIERFQESLHRKVAEKAYRSSNQHLRALMIATHDVIFKMNADWSVMQTLDGRNFLADTNEPNHDWLKKYIHPDDHNAMMEAVHKALKAKGVFQFEHRVIQADGSVGWAFSRAIPILNNRNEAIEWFGAASDVTLRKKAEAALVESEAKFRAMADNIPNLAWMANSDGWITWYNKKWYDYTNTTPAQMEGWGWQSVHDPEHLPAVMSKWKQSIDSGRPFEMIFPLKGHDGVFRPFLTRVLPVKDESGKIVRWFGTNTDVTDQKQEEEKLERLVKERTAQLERSNQDLLQFAHVASHDLKEPLRKIQTFADLLETELSEKLSPKAKSYIDKINMASERLSNMIAGVLGYSQVNSEFKETSVVDLNKVLHDIENDLEIAIAQSGSRLIINPLPTLEGAEILLYQLYYNLINNSIKFRKNDGEPVIEVSCLTATAQKVHLIVKDNGIGFDQQFADVIFNTFSRLHPKDRYEGTGLGLSLCKKIVARHNGLIWAQSTKGNGAEFHIELPVAQTLGTI